MKSDASTVEAYLDQLPPDRREVVEVVRDTINAHLPVGYVESMAFGMIGWGIPLEDYPDTYNAQPLGIAALASQKNHLSLYLMGLYADDGLEDWFRQAYAARGLRLDLGKSCVRFTRLEQMPLDVLGELIERVPPATLIEHYEASRGR